MKISLLSVQNFQILLLVLQNCSLIFSPNLFKNIRKHSLSQKHGQKFVTQNVGWLLKTFRGT